MRIYEVSFDGRTKGEDGGEWGSNWEKVNVAVDGDASAAIELAEKEVTPGECYELRPAEVRMLAEAP